MATIYEIKQQAAAVKNATQVGENTAERVGGALAGLAEIAEENAQGIIFDVSAHNNGAVFKSLQSLLGSSNLDTLIPASVRHGGMSIRFIQGSDNKYVQYRLMTNAWSTTVTDWQGVDDEPTFESNNLVKSGGVAGELYKFEGEDRYTSLYKLENHTIISGYDQSIQFNLQAHVGETLYLSVSNSGQYGWYDTSFKFTSLGHGSTDKKEFVVPSNAKGFWLFGEGVVADVEIFSKETIITKTSRIDVIDDRINVIEGDLYKEVHDYQKIYELLNHTIISGYDQSIQFNLQAHVGETLYLSVSNSGQYGWYDTSFKFTSLGHGSTDKKEFVVPSNAKGFWLFGEGIVTNVEVYDKSKIIIVDNITPLEQDVESIKNTLSPISQNFQQIALNTDNLCKVSASRKNIKMLVYGDSITNNASFTIQNGKTTAYVETIQRVFTIDGVTYKFKNWVRLLRNYFHFQDIRNYAIDGAHYKTTNVTSGMERQNLQYQIDLSFADLDSNNVFATSGNFVPDIVVFALGINDVVPNDTFESAMAKSVMYSDDSGIDIDATIANLDTTKFFEAVRCAYLRIKKQFPFATVFSVLPLQTGIPNRLQYAKVLHDSIEEMANKCGVICIDGTYNSGIISDGEKNGHKSTYLVDGLHPNGNGHNLYVKMVANAIKCNFVEDVELNQ